MKYMTTTTSTGALPSVAKPVTRDGFLQLYDNRCIYIGQMRPFASRKVAPDVSSSILAIIKTSQFTYFLNLIPSNYIQDQPSFLLHRT
jgi:hypothetical protein